MALVPLHASDSGFSLNSGPGKKRCNLAGWGLSFFVCYLVYRSLPDDFALTKIFSGGGQPDDLKMSQHIDSVASVYSPYH